MGAPTYLAVDFGASGGRVIAGTLLPCPGGRELMMKEIYRFPNRPVRIGDYLYWDFPALFSEMLTGLSKAAASLSDIASIGIDTWGVDFGLIDRLGNLVGNPICYRDNHTEGMTEEFFEFISPSDHYAEAGIQILPINTLFRLAAMKKAGDPKLEIGRHLLFMPDLFSYYLTGKAANEYTIATTSELMLAQEREWNFALMKTAGIDPALFGEIILPGTSRGQLLKEVREATSLDENVEVIAVGSHDTASAVFAVAEEYHATRAAFLSCGTWSLLGTVLDSPILTEEARLADYTNEGGVGGKIRLLTNITGLWILQQLKYDWAKRGDDLSWDLLTDEAEKSDCQTIIDVDDPVFQNPEGMEKTIVSYCSAHNLAIPGTKGDFVRCVCNSLAERYRKAIDNLNTLLPVRVKRLVVFGGGTKNRLLMRLTAEKTGLEVIVKESEATAIGNLMVQAIAHGDIKDRKEIVKISGL